MKNRIGKLVFFFMLTTWSNYSFSQVKYSFNNFDNFNYPDDLAPNHFFGNWGPLISEYINIEFDKTIRYGDSGNSLKLSFHDLTGESFTGLWQSLWINSRPGIVLRPLFCRWLWIWTLCLCDCWA